VEREKRLQIRLFALVEAAQLERHDPHEHEVEEQEDVGHGRGEVARELAFGESPDIAHGGCS
jgi:hypothetical protein